MGKKHNGSQQQIIKVPRHQNTIFLVCSMWTENKGDQQKKEIHRKQVKKNIYNFFLFILKKKKKKKEKNKNRTPSFSSF